LKRSLFVIGSDLSAKTVVIASSPLLAYALSVEDFATFIVLQSIMALSTIIQFGGADLSLSIHASDPKNERGDVFASCTKIAFMSLGIVFITIGVVLYSFGEMLGISNQSAILFVAGMIPLSIGVWYIYLMRIAQKNTVFALSTLVLKFAPFIPAISIAIFWSNIEERLHVYLIILMFALVIAAIIVRKIQMRICIIPMSNEVRNMRRFLITGITVLPGSLAYACVWTLDKPLARIIWGDTAVGALGIAALLGSTILLLRGWLTLLWEPVIIELSHNNDPKRLMVQLQVVFEIVVISITGAAAIGILWAPNVINIFYPDQMGIAKEIVVYYFIAAALAGINTILSATILISRSAIAQLLNMIFALCIFIAIYLVLGEQIGLKVMPIAIIGAELWILIFYTYLGQIRFKNLEVTWIRVILPASFTLAIAIGAYNKNINLNLFSSIIIIFLIFYSLVKLQKSTK
jgi:O-antigen/teichoic acid export membrane protein